MILGGRLPGKVGRCRIYLYVGVAQLARANGSYPLGRWFKSIRRYHGFGGWCISATEIRFKQSFMARWSSGLRLRPLTAATGVRIPYGSPRQNKLHIVCFILTIKTRLISLFLFCNKKSRSRRRILVNADFWRRLVCYQFFVRKVTIWLSKDNR